MLSYWEKEFWFPHYDYAIIGSGIVGLSCAIKVKEQFPKAKVVVIERGHLPQGASTKNAGFACFGTIGELLDDLEYQSESELVETIRLRWNGLKILRKLVPESEMQYINQGGVELVENENEFEAYNSKKNYINSLLEEAIGEAGVIQCINQDLSSSFYKYSFFNKFESQLNPALMIKHMIKRLKTLGVDIMNSCEVNSYINNSLGIEINIQNGLKVECSTMIICTNAFTNALLPGHDIVPARNQVIVTEELDDLKWKGCHHFDKGYIYFRDLGKRLLLGGARNIDLLGEQTEKFGSNERVLQHLRHFLLKLGINEDVKIDFSWSGIIATGKSKKPIVKKVEDNVYTAVRLGGMGVAIGSGLAEEVINLIKK